MFFSLCRGLSCGLLAYPTQIPIDIRLETFQMSSLRDLSRPSVLAVIRFMVVTLDTAVVLTPKCLVSLVLCPCYHCRIGICPLIMYVIFSRLVKAHS